MISFETFMAVQVEILFRKHIKSETIKLIRTVQFGKAKYGLAKILCTLFLQTHLFLTNTFEFIKNKSGQCKMYDKENIL